MGGNSSTAYYSGFEPTKPAPDRGGRSHIFRFRLGSCSKIFESGSWSQSFLNLRIRLLFKLRKQSMQPKFNYVFHIYKDNRDSCYCRKWKLIRVRFFTNFWLRLYVRKKTHNLAGVDSSTPDPRPPLAHAGVARKYPQGQWWLFNFCTVLSELFQSMLDVRTRRSAELSTTCMSTNYV